MNYRLSFQQGATIVMALLLLLVMSLLTLQGLRSSQLELKTTVYLHQSEQLFYAAERGLKQAEQRIMAADEFSCLFYYGEIDYGRRPAAWWRSSRICSFQEGDYTVQFIVESLPTINCLAIVVDDKAFRASYYRITLRAYLTAGGPATILQTTLVKQGRAKIANCKAEEIIHVKQGRQSWVKRR